MMASEDCLATSASRGVLGVALFERAGHAVESVADRIELRQREVRQPRVELAALHLRQPAQDRCHRPQRAAEQPEHHAVDQHQETQRQPDQIPHVIPRVQNRARRIRCDHDAAAFDGKLDLLRARRHQMREPAAARTRPALYTGGGEV